MKGLELNNDGGKQVDNDDGHYILFHINQQAKKLNSDPFTLICPITKLLDFFSYQNVDQIIVQKYHMQGIIYSKIRENI